MRQQEDGAWLDYRERFSRVYDGSNYSSPVQRFVMGASHRLIERDFGPERYLSTILEVGAGTGEHFPYVRHRYDRYFMTDLDPKALEVARKKLASWPGHEKIVFETQEGSQAPYADNTFDRVVAVHILEHICQPQLAIKEWARILKPGGMLSILIPTDPGIAWRLGRHLGPRKNALAQGIPYDYVMAREHVNSCNSLIALLRFYFKNPRESWWPFPVASMDLNLFFAFNASVDKQALQSVVASES